MDQSQVDLLLKEVPDNTFTQNKTEDYKRAQPFPHIVIDNYFAADVAQQLEQEFPIGLDQKWIHYLHYNEKTYGLNKKQAFSNSIQKLLNYCKSEEFIHFLEQTTGIKGLHFDNDLEGAGLHQTKNGGFLNVHADFLHHPFKKKWKRRVNVLIYLNRDWKDEYGGHLEFWSANMKNCVKKIAPIANRMVIFSTTETSFHGYPEPISCPDSVSRKSIAFYYYTIEEKDLGLGVTKYKPIPGAGHKAFFIWLDVKLLAIYSWLKRTFNLKDNFVSKILSIFRKKES